MNLGTLIRYTSMDQKLWKSQNLFVVISQYQGCLMDLSTYTLIKSGPVHKLKSSHTQTRKTLFEKKEGCYEMPIQIFKVLSCVVFRSCYSGWVTENRLNSFMTAHSENRGRTTPQRCNMHKYAVLFVFVSHRTRGVAWLYLFHYKARGCVKLVWRYLNYVPPQVLLHFHQSVSQKDYTKRIELICTKPGRGMGHTEICTLSISCSIL